MADRDRSGGVETDITGLDAASAPQTAGVNPDSELKVDDGPGSLILHGKRTVVTSGTPVSLLGNGVECRGVIIKNLTTNSGNPIVYVGRTGVSSADGYELVKGESVPLNVDNAEDEIFVDADANGVVVGYLGVAKDK
jgi:hypothetical protein